MLSRQHAVFLVGAGALAVAGTAHATWSIVLIDLRTNEIAIGSATCLPNEDIIDDAILLTGIGGAAAQAFWDPTGQIPVFIRDRIALSVAPEEILAALSMFDPGHQTRQYGFVDSLGRVAAFTGTTVNNVAQWAGAATGQFENVYLGQTGTIVYAIQGNVLAGPCVLDDTVNAVITTSGDLPAKLMAGMQAARLAGGDGRCSCSAANPTACGCPVPSFSKSSHVGFMLIARVGDTDGSFGIYRAGNGAWSVAARDIDGDALPELFSANQSSGNASVLRNATPADSRFAMFGLATNYTTGPGTRSIALADITGDSLDDVVTSNFSNGTLSVLPGRADGTFGPKTDYPAGANPLALAIADLDGVDSPDVAVANPNLDTVSVLLNNGAGGLLPRQSYPAGDNPQDLIAARIDANDSWDLALTARNESRVVILLNDGAAVFTRAPDVPTPPGPAYLAAGDLDGDNDTDLAVATQVAPFSAVVLLNTGDGTYTSESYPLPAMPTGIAAGDVTGDGPPDLVLPLAIDRFVVLRGSPTGEFTEAGSYLVRKTLFDVALADLNADGDLDAAFASQGTNLIVADNQGDGVFPDGLGAANGDYFMTFNVAFQSAAATDPVVQLQNMFDTWRAALVGRPDGVQSIIDISPPRIPADGVATADLTFTLRDFAGAASPVPIESITIVHAPGSAGQSTIQPLQPLGDAMYRVSVTAGNSPGVDRFRITIDDGVRPVALAPDPELILESPPPCPADFNADGIANSQDFFDFLGAFFAGSPAADFNADGAINSQDFFDFLGAFFDGC